MKTKTLLIHNSNEKVKNVGVRGGSWVRGKSDILECTIPIRLSPDGGGGHKGSSGVVVVVPRQTEEVRWWSGCPRLQQRGCHPADAVMEMMSSGQVVAHLDPQVHVLVVQLLQFTRQLVVETKEGVVGCFGFAQLTNQKAPTGVPLEPVTKRGGIGC